MASWPRLGQWISVFRSSSADPPEVVNFGRGIGVTYTDLAKQFDWLCFTRRLRQLVERSVPGRDTPLPATRVLPAQSPFTVVALDRWALPCPCPELCDEPVTVVAELCTPKDAEAAAINIKYGSVAEFLVDHGFGLGGRNTS